MGVFWKEKKRGEGDKRGEVDLRVEIIEIYIFLLDPGDFQPGVEGA